MKKISIGQIIESTNGKLIQGDLEQYITGASIDSRIVEQGELFVAIKGENTDGHKYISKAVERGCEAVLIENDEYAKPVPGKVAMILVEDTVESLQKIASCYRQSLNMKIIGVTGSVGKTSTADMLKSVCSQKYKTAKTKGNFNNHIGLPLSILGFEPDTEVGILEMGMDRKGEIDFLASIAKPDIGIITNIGTAHIEHLGTRENIFKAKMEITNYFTKDSTLVVNGDDEFLKEIKECKYKVMKAGTGAGNNIFLYNIDDKGEMGVDFTVEYKEAAKRMHIPVPGRHNALNATLATAVAYMMGITPEDVKKGLEKLEITDKRLTVKGKNGIKIIDDTYNASPASMKAAIDVLNSMKGIRKIAILGDMFEMGENSSEYHRQVGEYAAEKNLDMVIAIGKDAKFIEEGAQKNMSKEKVKYYKSKADFLREIKNIITSGDVVLVKGSRGMAMDLIVKKIME